MPEKFKQKVDVYFVFNVSTKGRTSRGGFGDFISDIVGAGITLRSVAGFVIGRQIKLFCVTDDAETFLAFAKKRGLRVRQKQVLIYTGAGPFAAVVRDTFVDATLHTVQPAFSFSSRGEAFIYQDKPA